MNRDYFFYSRIYKLRFRNNCEYELNTRSYCQSFAVFQNVFKGGELTDSMLLQLCASQLGVYCLDMQFIFYTCTTQVFALLNQRLYCVYSFKKIRRIKRKNMIKKRISLYAWNEFTNCYNCDSKLKNLNWNMIEHVWLIEHEFVQHEYYWTWIETWIETWLNWTNSCRMEILAS